MIDHLSSYTTDFDAAKAFYDSVFRVLGHSIQSELVMSWDTELPNRRACGYGPADRPVFWVIESREKASPRHVAFSAPDRATVAAFHTAGLAAGGSDHGAPGLRTIYHEHYFGAFLIDPDGNNVEAVCHAPEP